MARLPGVQPLDMAEWLIQDEVFEAQMAAREVLLTQRRADVFAALPETEAASANLLDLILQHLPSSYQRGEGSVTRPDGATVTLNDDHPLISAARLVQEDLCILQPDGQGQHRLTAAVLCFPASWTLAEKIGRPLDAIHDPVDSYTDDMARRVQRLFDAIRPGRPLWRQNALLYTDAQLYQPRAASDPRVPPKAPSYLRSERQSLVRLDPVDAVAFTIHTYVVPISSLPADAQAGLDRVEVAG